MTPEPEPEPEPEPQPQPQPEPEPDLLPGRAVVFASVSTGLEGIAAAEAAEALGGPTTSVAQPCAGRLRIELAAAAAPGLLALRCVGQLTLVVAEGTLSGRGSADAAEADLAGLAERGRRADWAGALALRRRMLLPTLPSGGGAAAAAAAAPPRFRVTCKRTTADDGRATSVEHGFTSVRAASALGGAIAGATDWTVSLRDHELEVMLIIEADRWALGLKVGDSARPRAGAAEGVMLGSTALKVPLAHAMSRLALVGGPAGLVCDPFAGGGTLGLEACSFWPVFSINGDVHEKEVARLGRSLAGAAGQASASASHRCGALLWDAKALPLRDGCVDSVVCDLPWGQRSGSRAENAALYPAAVQEWARVLRPDGRAVCLTADRASIEAALSLPAASRSFAVAAEHRVNVSGKWACLLVLRRR